MAQIEQIKAELERQIEELYTEYQELAKYEVWKTANDKKIAFQTLKSFLSFIESMEKEQPSYDTVCNEIFGVKEPQELDEAAEEQWAAMEYASTAARESSSVRDWCTDDIVNAFKAGAKWMAEQGEIHETTVLENYDGLLIEDMSVSQDIFKKSDNVIVQIRKK